jgi:hypothetical protein
MVFEDYDKDRRFREAWSAVEIVRPVHYSLFTFGESELPYYLVCGQRDSNAPVSITQGEVRIKRPMIITRDTARPEFRNFFDDDEQEGLVEFLLARSAHFSNLQFVNQRGAPQLVRDGMDAAVAQLNRKLDDEGEDRVAILTAPPNLGGIAVLRYAAQRVWQSAPDNIQELRERGFLP